MSAKAERRGLIHWLASISDGAIVRTVFYALLAGALGVLYIDYSEMTGEELPGLAGPLQPVLPAFDPDSPATAPGPSVTTDFELLKEALKIDLGPGGVLNLTGTIDPGSAERVSAEILARGEYIKTVAFNSPGGSVSDAIAIGAQISEHGFATSVAAGELCASSCPLAFAGGRERHATPQSAIGVHQVYAAVAAGELPHGIRAAGDAMSDVQKTTAVITRHLKDMGVDPAVWLHALETPPDRLYYLTPAELVEYKLVTALDGETNSVAGETGDKPPEPVT